VVKLTRQDIEEIFTLRTALESLAIELTMLHSPLNKIEELKMLVDMMHQAAEKTIWGKWLIRIMLFTCGLLKTSHNSRLIRTWLKMSAHYVYSCLLRNNLP
jgi:DNA-binding GntR family transcriptional regulator